MPIRPADPNSPFAQRLAAELAPCLDCQPPSSGPGPEDDSREKSRHSPVRKRATSAEDADYAVGKWKPPVHTRFRSGVSGNPAGRPKGAKSLRTLTLEILGEKKTVRTPSGTRMMNAAEYSLSKLVQQVGEGKDRALKQVIDLWREAVPNEVPSSNPGISGTDLDPVQQQIWDMLLGQLEAPKVRRRSAKGGNDAAH
jgi:hypothetical protein